MNLLFHLLFIFKFLKLSPENVQLWTKQRNIPKLIFALKNGTYKVRKAAATQLGTLQNQEAIPALINATKDDTRIVAEASINALKHFSNNKKVRQVLKEVKVFWNLKTIKHENKRVFFENAKKVYKEPNVLFDKTKLKNLTKVKRTLASRMPRLGA